MMALQDDSNGWEPYENGCYPGTGQVFGPTLLICIIPMDEGCPREGESFTGHMALPCDQGRCMVNQECLVFDDKNFSLLWGAYLGLLEALAFTESCSTNCTTLSPLRKLQKQLRFVCVKKAASGLLFCEHCEQ